MTAYWWTCPHVWCFDRLRESTNPDDVMRDQAEHLRRAHPGWQPTDAEKRLSCWPTLTNSNA